MRKVLSSYILTIISLSLVLFLLGLYLIVASQTNQITDSLKEKINIVIELQEEYSDSDREGLLTNLKNNEAVIESSIQFLGKEEAKKIMIGEDDLVFMDDSLQNPFRDAIIINLHSTNYNSNFLDQFSNNLRARKSVAEVFYQKDFFELVNSNLSKISTIFLVVGILMLLLAVSLIYNTVNLSLATDKQKIQTMELVGAERKYIERPYLLRAFKTGFISFSIALLLLLACTLLLLSNYEFLQNVVSYLSLSLIVILLLVLGVIIPVLSTKRIVNSHLNQI